MHLSLFTNDIFIFTKSSSTFVEAWIYPTLICAITIEYLIHISIGATGPRHNDTAVQPHMICHIGLHYMTIPLQ